MSAWSDTPLAELQTAFAASLMARDDSVPGEVRGGGDRASTPKRFNIYRNTVFSCLGETLRARFPAVARLVGEEFFRAAASTFIGALPPLSPALLEYGKRFPEFLAAFEPAQALPYLPDVARLEWLRHAAYHAPDAEPMDGARLGAVAADDLAGLTLHLHPSAGLILSAYPVFSIWRTNVSDAAVCRIGAEMSGEAALVLRPRLEVTTLLLPAGGGAFIAAVADGAELAEAAEAARNVPGFMLAQTLGACLAADAFTGFSLKGGTS